MVNYWDTSCVLKLYCRESDSEYFLNALAEADTVPHSTVLLETELFFAFQQKEIRKEIKGNTARSLFEEFRADVNCGRFILLPMSADVYEQARKIARLCYANDPPISLRTLDGIHLAAAQISRCKTLFSTDRRMQGAARLLGLNMGNREAI